MSLTMNRKKEVNLTVWQPFLVLVLHDIRQLRKEAARFVARIATITLSTVFVFDFVLPQLQGQSLGITAQYATVLAPGLVAIGICNQALTTTLTAMSYDFGPLRRIDQTLMAPLPVPLVALARIIDGTLHGAFSACVTLPIVTFVHAPGASPSLDLTRWPLLLCAVVGAGVLFAALGVAIGATVNPAKASNVAPYILPIMIMLGCIYYPWSSLGPIPWLKYGVLANPVVYVTEATRFAITPQLDHLPGYVLLWSIGAGATLTTVVGMTRFSMRARQ
ncbi:ABC transporter permease [Streptomyces sp. NPDC001027]|uniref:ABC transporter permease n=1 Tax=Streptomyces sp. NPDC001027 TaxID=3154771 RepID=UPI00332707E5